MKSIRPLLRLLLAVYSLASLSAGTQKPVFSQNPRPEWQWGVTLDGFSDKPVPSRAYLWVPPGCKRLRGVVVGQQNLEEEQIFENPIFRRALTDLNFALVWVTPAYDLFFRFDRGSGEKFDTMLKRLADESGYAELPLVPVVPIGHSAAASSPWNFGAWAPGRTLAAISVSGQWAYYKDENTPDWGDRKVDGVPGLVTMGEYESAYKRAETGVWERSQHPMLPLTMLAEPAGEHFAGTDLKISFIGLYLRKAAQYRLPADWPIRERPKLKEIDPTKTGWLTDRARPDGKPSAPAAPVGKYTGDEKNAFWVFDEELAKAVEKVAAMYAGKKYQLIGYVQNGAVVPKRKSHVRVGLKLDIASDDLTFKLGGAFLDTADADYGGFGMKTGDPAPHAADTSSFNIVRTIGAVEKRGPDTFALRFSRNTLNDPDGSTVMGFILSHPGDDTYRPMALESDCRVWCRNREGKPQEITGFNPPASNRAGTRTLDLSAKSTADLPVFYYVREGPAVIENDRTLRFTEIPPRAKFPVKVTVVAWQWGRMVEPKVQSAQPVERTFSIIK
ncbi:MAG: hypothetical protein KDN05_04460 [Verrucomicrobiae bacterium]|nr:hypothetical protein [Verrucomicrobiae bacterium]MCP5532310.1 hypothetical protein [Akkermansiaceae bacterium]